jgi:hypothetical protein
MIQIDEKPHHRSGPLRRTLIYSRPPAARHRCAAVAAVLVLVVAPRTRTGLQRSATPQPQPLAAGGGPGQSNFIFLSGCWQVSCYRALAAVRLLGFRSGSDANRVSNLCRQIQPDTSPAAALPSPSHPRQMSFPLD